MAEHHHEPYRGEFPEVHDEAGDSPRWLPALGFAILFVFSLFIAYRSATSSEEPGVVETAVETTEAAEAAAAPAAAEAAH